MISRQLFNTLVILHSFFLNLLIYIYLYTSYITLLVISRLESIAHTTLLPGKHIPNARLKKVKRAKQQEEKRKQEATKLKLFLPLIVSPCVSNGCRKWEKLIKKSLLNADRTHEDKRNEKKIDTHVEKIKIRWNNLRCVFVNGRGGSSDPLESNSFFFFPFIKIEIKNIFLCRKTHWKRRHAEHKVFN